MLFGQRPDNRRIEPRCLCGPQNFSHRKNVGERIFLKFAHRDMRLIHGGSDLWPGVMLLSNGFGQPSIITPQFQLAGTSSRGETEFQLLQRRALIGIEVKSFVHKLMEIDRGRGGCRQKCASDCNTDDAGKQRNSADGQPLPKPQADHAPSSVESA